MAISPLPIVAVVLMLVTARGRVNGPAFVLGWIVRQLRGRPRGDAEPETPKWMRALDRLTPPKAAGTAVLLSAVNPKNLLLAVAGAATIAQTGIDAGEQTIAYAVFVLIASAGVALPVVIALVMGDRSSALLHDMKD